MNTIKTMTTSEKKIHELINLYRTFGYHEAHFQVLEHYNSYRNDEKYFQDKNILKVVLGGELYILRPDMTIPLVKKISEHNRLSPLGEKCYYRGTVFRGSDGVEFNIKEKNQIGIEAINVHDKDIDSEIVQLANKSLDMVNENYCLEISTTVFLETLFSEMDMSKKLKKELLVLLESKNRCDIEKKVKALKISENHKKILVELPLCFGKIESIKSFISDLKFSEKLQEVIKSLEQFSTTLSQLFNTEKIQFDLSMVQDLDYYNGLIFQGYVENISYPILSGGRYDGISKKFNKNFPSIGFALDVETLLKDDYTSKVDILILYNDVDKKAAFDLANLKRALGKSVQTASLEGLETMDKSILAEYYDEIIDITKGGTPWH